jgi:uncharacterized membrane protein YidH (DUF202 family)
MNLLYMNYSVGAMICIMGLYLVVTANSDNNRFDTNINLLPNIPGSQSKFILSNINLQKTNTIMYSGISMIVFGLIILGISYSM